MTASSDDQKRAERRRRLFAGALVASVWMALGVLIGLTRPWISASACTREALGDAVAAPDGAHAVQMVLEICDRGWVLVEIVTRLEGWRAATPTQRHVLAGWESAVDGSGASVRWTGDGALRLELRDMLGAWVRPPPLAGISLTLVQAAPARDAPGPRDAARKP